MGNRAVIVFQNFDDETPCLYTHWNGGVSKVEAMLTMMSDFFDEGTLAKVATSKAAQGVFWGVCRDVQKLFDLGTVCVESMGCTDSDNRDNGLYILDPTLRIVGRQFVPEGAEMVIDNEDREGYLSHLRSLENAKANQLGGVLRAGIIELWKVIKEEEGKAPEADPAPVFRFAGMF